MFGQNNGRENTYMVFCTIRL